MQPPRRKTRSAGQTGSCCPQTIDAGKSGAEILSATRYGVVPVPPKDGPNPGVKDGGEVPNPGVVDGLPKLGVVDDPPRPGVVDDPPSPGVADPPLTLLSSVLSRSSSSSTRR